MTTVVTREQAGGEVHELQVPPSNPVVLGAAGGGQQLDPISEEGNRAEEGREGDQNTSDRGAEGLSGDVGARPKQTPVKVIGLPPFHVEKLMGLRTFHHYCIPCKETSTNKMSAINLFHKGVHPENLMTDQNISLELLEKTGDWFNEALIEHNLKDWCIKDSEHGMMAKLVIVYKIATAAKKFEGLSTMLPFNIRVQTLHAK